MIYLFIRHLYSPPPPIRRLQLVPFNGAQISPAQGQQSTVPGSGNNSGMISEGPKYPL